MRMMSFRLTTAQIRDRSKTVTRRLGWKFAKPGDRIRAVVKARGLKKGERPEELALLEIIDVRRERLVAISFPVEGWEEVAREGFPDKSPIGFIDMFCREMKCGPLDKVTRIEFKYL